MSLCMCVGGLSVCMYGVCGGCGVYMWFCVCVCVCVWLCVWGCVCVVLCVVCVWRQQVVARGGGGPFKTLAF